MRGYLRAFGIPTLFLVSLLCFFAMYVPTTKAYAVTEYAAAPQFEEEMGQVFDMAPGDSRELSVTASSSDGGTLSYQWHTCTIAPAPIPGLSTTLEGETTNKCTAVAGDTPGNTYYICEVTNTVEGKTAVTNCWYATVRVLATSGTWGQEEGGVWSYDSGSDTLTVSGSGALPDYTAASSAPWKVLYGSLMGDDSTIIVGSGITSIGSMAFADATAASIEIEGNVASVGASAFSGSSIKEICLPDGLENVPSKLCCNCKRLESIAIPANVSSIGNSAFSKCANLQDLSFADESKCREIGDRAFMDCALESVFLPDKCESIGEKAFQSSVLKSASVPSGCAFVEEAADEQGVWLDTFYRSSVDVTKRCTVSFLDDSGAVIGTEDASYICAGPNKVEAGSASYSGDTPTKVSDGEYVYTFAGWVTEQGGSTPADLDAVTGDMTVYASYTAMSKAAAEAKDAIEALPADGVVDSDEDAALVEAATEAYLNLTDEQRAELSDDAVAALVSAQGSLVAYKKAALAAAQEESAKAQAAAAAELEQAKADLAKAQAAAGLKASSLKVTAKAVSAKANKKTKVSAKKAFAVTGAAGNLTYAKLKGSAKISVSAKGKVTVKKGLKKNKTYKVKVLVADSGSSTVAAANAIVTLKVKVKK